MIEIKNKKGLWAIETILKLVLGVLGIAILIYLAVSLHGIFLYKTDVEQARKNIEVIYQNVHKVDSGEENSVRFLIESPNGWQIISWFKEEGNVPGDCDDDYCVCLCPYGKFGDSREENLEKCKEGFCRDFSKPVKINPWEYFGGKSEILEENAPIIIEGATNLEITSDGKEITITHLPESESK